MTKKNNNDTMIHIGDLLKTAMGSCNNRADTDMTRVWDIWSDTVGDAVAENAQPQAFRKEVLIVTVSNSAWMHHLHFLKADIMGKLNTALEKNIIKEIKLKIGNL